MSFKPLSTLLLLLAASISAQANNWVIDKELSQLNFTSIKNNSVGENHHFKSFSGSLNKDGTFELIIDMTSVNTHIDIRDQRLKEHAFQTNKFPTATIQGVLDFIVEDTLVYSEQISATITLAGITSTIKARVTIDATNEEMFRVTSYHPILLSTDALKLSQGIEKLQKLAGLRSIDTVVPVTFDFYLKKVNSEASEQ